MAIFKKKTYTPADFARLQQKGYTYNKYSKLIKLLRHEDISVTLMAEDALQQLISSEDEKKKRIALFKAYPALYDKLIKKLEAVQSSNPSLKKVESILLNLKQDTTTLRAEREAERQEIETLRALLVEKGVSRAHLKNAKDLKALLEPNESIECAIGEGQRGTLISVNDYSLYTNKSIYIFRGLANQEGWGSITKMGYDAIHDIEDVGILIKKNKYRVSGKHDNAFSFTVAHNHPILGQLAKYGTDEVKDTMKRLGLMSGDTMAGQG